jgi:hypothetical protein
MQNEIFEQLRKVKINGETALLCKKLKMNALATDARRMHAKYDTACAIDK